jgi:regulator of protease activity HflC (stomatin/prohibitin superfamily)
VPREETGRSGRKCCAATRGVPLEAATGRSNRRRRRVRRATAVAAAALALLPPGVGTARPNLSGPSSAALVAVADALGGRLVGSLAPGRCFLRIDGVQLDVEPAGAAAAGRALAERIAAAAPAAEQAPGEAPDALAAAVAEAWPSWTATEPIWTGTGADLLTADLPPATRVLGVWFD